MNLSMKSSIKLHWKLPVKFPRRIPIKLPAKPSSNFPVNFLKKFRLNTEWNLLLIILTHGHGFFIILWLNNLLLNDAIRSYFLLPFFSIDDLEARNRPLLRTFLMQLEIAKRFREDFLDLFGQEIALGGHTNVFIARTNLLTTCDSHATVSLFFCVI